MYAVEGSLIRNLWTQLRLYDDEGDDFRNAIAKRLPIEVTTNIYDASAGRPVNAIISDIDELLNTRYVSRILRFRLDLSTFHRAISAVSDEASVSVIKAITFGRCQENDSPVCSDLWSLFSTKVSRHDVVCASEVISRVKYVVPRESGWYVTNCSLHSIPHACIKKGYKARRFFDGLNDFYPPAAKGDWAHTRLDLETLLASVSTLSLDLQRNNVRIINDVLNICPLGTYNATVTGLVLGSLSFPILHKVLCHLSSIKMCCLTAAKLVSRLKALSDAVRRTHCNFEGSKLQAIEIVQLSYWHMCSSRQLSTSNWDKERQERSEVLQYNTVAGTDFKSRINLEVNAAVMCICRRVRTKPITWPEFVATRQRHVSAGSTGGVKTQIGSELVTAGKRVYFENIRTEDVEAWLWTEPKIVANASEKFELGKSRAIYGTQPIDFTIMTYVLLPLEDMLESLTGVQHKNMMPLAARRMMHRLKTIRGQCNNGLMIDFANFNLQHSLEMQSFVFRCIAKQASVLQWPLSYIEAALWCARAMLNSNIIYPGDSEPTRIHQGLFSGLRGTAFLNSLLNYCYYQAADFTVSELLPELTVRRVSYHQGDDVWLTSTDVVYNVTLYHVMLAAGFVFEPSKQNIARGTGEFLRVWYSENGCYGFPARSIASLIIAPLQSSPAHDHVEEARALDAQLRVILRRGVPMRLISALWRNIVVYKLTKVVSTQTVSMEIASKALSCSALFGGLGCPDPSLVGVRRSVRIMNRRPIFIQKMLLPSLAQSFMSSCLVSNLAAEIKEQVDLGKLAEGLRRCNYSGWSGAIIDDLELERRYEQKMLKWLMQFQKLSLDCEFGRDVKKGMVHRLNDNVILMIAEDVYKDFVDLVKSPINSSCLRNNTTLAAVKMRALANSPYSSIAEIKSAAQCSVYDAYIILIAACHDLEVAAALRRRIHHLFDASMAGVRNFWLEGLASMPVALTNKWHPDMASYIHGEAMDRLLTLCVLTQVQDYKETVEYCHLLDTTLVKIATQDELICILSRY